MAADFNCDLGEGTGNDALIIPYITSANIACGYHAGDVDTIQQTMGLCRQYNVNIGAHPSFLDKAGFGRTAFHLSENEIYELIIQQLIIFSSVADTMNVKISHVKPHGSLYNMSAADAMIAGTIARAVKDFDHMLLLYGLSGSESIKQAQKIGLRTANEVFADRTYQDDGSLTPRKYANALIIEEEKVVAQVLQMLQKGTATTTSGKEIPIVADTVCLHGDGAHAVELAKAIHKAING